MLGSSCRDDVPTWSAGEEERREEDADRLVATEQGDRDAGEADRAGREVAHVHRELDAEHVDGPRDSCERARDREREEVAAPDRDPAVARRLGVEADRADLEPERRPVEDDVVDEEPEERDEDAGMQRLDVAPEHPQPSRLRHDLRPRQRGDGALERSPELEQVPASEDRDPVEHDRRDHLVGADGGTEDPGDPTPDRSADDPRDEPEQHVQRPRGAFQVRPDPERGDEADPVLTLPSDVEEAAAERERDREPGQHQRRREDQRLLQVPRRARPV